MMNISPDSMSLINCEIYQRERVSSVADTELVLAIAHLNPTTKFNSWRRMSQAQYNKKMIAPNSHVRYKEGVQREGVKGEGEEEAKIKEREA